MQGARWSGPVTVIPGRIQTVNLVLNNKEYLLINVYGPNIEDKVFFRTLDNFISDYENSRIIIGGDLNTILNSELDKKKKVA